MALQQFHLLWGQAVEFRISFKARNSSKSMMDCDMIVNSWSCNSNLLGYGQGTPMTLPFPVWMRSSSLVKGSCWFPSTTLNFCNCLDIPETRLCDQAHGRYVISATQKEIALGGERNQQLVGDDDPGYEFTFSDFDGGFEARFPLIPGGQAEDIQRATITRTASNGGDRRELVWGEFCGWDRKIVVVYSKNR